MSNFQATFEAGQAGQNRGLTTGIPGLDSAINGVQKKSSIGLAAAPKCGKTTLADYCFLINPYLQLEREGRLDKIHWIYNSYEIDRVSKEFKVAAFFMYHDFGRWDVTYRGVKYPITGDYLMGRQLHRITDTDFEIVPVTPEDVEIVKTIYRSRIVPMFGKYDIYGNKLELGKVEFLDDPDNPTGMDKHLKDYAKKNGRYIETKYTTSDNKVGTRIDGYIPNDPEKFTIIITDHIRKLRKEKGYNMKDNIDKWLEYSTWHRNKSDFTFINICHSNRGISNVERLKFAGENIFPTADDVKDTGNLAEESTILMTLFNPNDEKYNLTRHMGVDLDQHPNYRSLHITESRNTPSPAHIQLNAFLNVNLFTPI